MLRPIDLLRKLSSGIRPDGANPSGESGAPAFDRVLASTEPPVAVRPLDLGGALELSDEDQERLSIAVDAGEARGAQSLLVVMGEHALGVDVAARAVRTSGSSLEGQVLDGFEGVVLIPEVGARELRERLEDPVSHAEATGDPRAPLWGLASNVSLGALLE